MQQQEDDDDEGLNLLDLTDEVLVHVATFLDIGAQTCALACVSKRLHGLMEDPVLWRRLYTTQFGAPVFSPPTTGAEWRKLALPLAKYVQKVYAKANEKRMIRLFDHAVTKGHHGFIRRMVTDAKLGPALIRQALHGVLDLLHSNKTNSNSNNNNDNSHSTPPRASTQHTDNGHSCSDNNNTNRPRRYLLHEAAKADAPTVVKLLTREFGWDVDGSNDEGKTPLFIAASNGFTETVRMLLRLDADPNAFHHGRSHECGLSALLSTFFGASLASKGATALWIAANNGHVETVKALVNGGGDLNVCANDGSSPFYQACKWDKKEVVQAILDLPRDKWPDINKATKVDNDASPLYIACDGNRTDIVRLLIERCGETLDLEKRNKNGSTGLYAASQFGHLEIVQVLIEAGANVNTTRVTGATPLMISILYGHTDIAKALLDAGALLDAVANDGLTPLLAAASRGNSKVLAHLLNLGLSLEGDVGQAAISSAIENKQTDIIRMMIARGAPSSAATEEYLETAEKQRQEALNKQQSENEVEEEEEEEETANGTLNVTIDMSGPAPRIYTTSAPPRNRAPVATTTTAPIPTTTTTTTTTTTANTTRTPRTTTNTTLPDTQGRHKRKRNLSEAEEKNKSKSKNKSKNKKKKKSNKHKKQRN
eukprot:TRINITY_DN4450_c1_g1_i1.p1 TRINITY_DN4450_c1_g1~~TRINITY_DN4450_c1_g1_i1.p1  ORF type:complete len:653 (+),score=142.19 TRINITY_DN4450_c1_g1_i1:134-2092(+)